MTVVDDPYQVAKDADVVVVLTEWAEFRNLDWVAIADAMEGDDVVDTRNLLDPGMILDAGLSWQGVGRPRAARRRVPVS